MITNTDMTHYSRGYSTSTKQETYTRQVIQGVFWQATKAANVLKSGLLNADRITVYIPMERGALTFKEGDIIVKGAITQEISGAYTPGNLRAAYEAAVIQTIDVHDAGSQNIRHWEIGAS